MVLGGILKIILVIAVIIIASSIVTFYLPSAFDGFNNWIVSLYNASLFLIEPQQGEAICDLIISTNVQLVQNPLLLQPSQFTPTEFAIPINNPYNYSYERCTIQGGFVIANLLDNGIGQAPRPTVSLQTNDAFLNPLGSDFVQQIRLIDARDPTQRIDWTLYPNLSYTTTIPPSVQQETPVSLNAQFVVPNIPVRTYNLELHLSGADLGINGMPNGVPFTGQICNQFQTFVAGSCR